MKSLTKMLDGDFERKLSKMLTDKRERLERDEPTLFHLWDSLTELQRRSVAERYDAQHPTRPSDIAHMELQIDHGFRAVKQSARNSKNAKRSRPSRQKVTDEEILRMSVDRSCAEAHRALYPEAKPGVSYRGFLKRWTKLGLGKKKKGT